MLKIPHNALVFVGDGRKALFLRNDGDAKFPNLKTEKVFEDENPPTHEQGSDRPGRVSKAAHWPVVEVLSSRPIGMTSKSTGSRGRSLRPWSRWSERARQRLSSWSRHQGH